MHHLFSDAAAPIPDPGQLLTIGGDEAVHALRVKRAEPGQAVSVMDGAGVIAEAVIHAAARAAKKGDGPTLTVRITARRQWPHPSLRPGLTVFTATPKGGRADDMIDQLSQLGVDAWAPLHTERGVVDPRDTKLTRLERITRESAKQCARPWLMQVLPRVSINDVMTRAELRVIVADESGEPWSPALQPDRHCALLIGPEGGWTATELDNLRSRGARLVRFGPHTMRIETAAAAASAIIMANHPQPSPSIE